MGARREGAAPLSHVVPLPTPFDSHLAAPQAYLKGADRANALVMGGKRLYFEAKEAKDAAATGRLLHLAAVALLQGAAAQPEGAAADRLRSSAAQVWCEAAVTAPTPRSAAKSFYTKAAELLRDGFGRGRSASRLVDALSCFVSAAAQAALAPLPSRRVLPSMHAPFNDVALAVCRAPLGATRRGRLGSRARGRRRRPRRGHRRRAHQAGAGTALLPGGQCAQGCALGRPRRGVVWQHRRRDRRDAVSHRPGKRRRWTRRSRSWRRASAGVLKAAPSMWQKASGLGDQRAGRETGGWGVGKGGGRSEVAGQSS